MQGEISGKVLGVDTVATLAGTDSGVVRVLKLQVEASAIDSEEINVDDLAVAMVPFSQVFYQDLHLQTPVTIGGEIQIRKVMPAGEEKRLAKQLDQLHTRAIGALKVWIKRYHLQAQQAALTQVMNQFLKGKFSMAAFSKQMQHTAFGDDQDTNTRVEKLRKALQPILKARAALVKDAPSVYWFVDADTIEYRGAGDPLEASGELQVIRLDGHSLEQSWAKWQQEMADAAKS
ncbi:hypothetical protein [Lacticaseibacillus porcinae]|uniref:hypothetical protein n=1 Tax=Lacticaseibacillus porcinae TaxID=1123687 RepID=UPI000F78633D|nr:hypothetical protein [Lacticaseibacillus porcinae]